MSATLWRYGFNRDGSILTRTLFVATGHVILIHVTIIFHRHRRNMFFNVFQHSPIHEPPNTIRVVDLHGFTLTRERVHDVALHPNHDLLLTVRPSLACSDSTSRARLKPHIHSPLTASTATIGSERNPLTQFMHELEVRGDAREHVLHVLHDPHSITRHLLSCRRVALIVQGVSAPDDTHPEHCSRQPDTALLFSITVRPARNHLHAPHPQLTATTTVFTAVVPRHLLARSQELNRRVMTHLHVDRVQ